MGEKQQNGAQWLSHSPRPLLPQPPPPALDPTTVSRAHATSRHPVLTVLPS